MGGAGDIGQKLLLFFFIYFYALFTSYNKAYDFLKIKNEENVKAKRYLSVLPHS